MFGQRCQFLPTTTQLLTIKSNSDTSERIVSFREAPTHVRKFLEECVMFTGGDSNWVSFATVAAVQTILPTTYFKVDFLTRQLSQSMVCVSLLPSPWHSIASDVTAIFSFSFSFISLSVWIYITYGFVSTFIVTYGFSFSMRLSVSVSVSV